MKLFSLTLLFLFLCIQIVLSARFRYQPVAQNAESGMASSVASNGDDKREQKIKKHSLPDLNQPAPSRMNDSQLSVESGHSVQIFKKKKEKKELKDTANSNKRRPRVPAILTFYQHQTVGGVVNQPATILDHTHPLTSNPFPFGSQERKEETKRRRKEAAIRRNEIKRQSKKIFKNDNNNI